MTGSEKQTAWAEKIIEEALTTCKTAVSQFEKMDATKDMARKYQIALDMLEKGFSSSEAQNASWIIENRSNFTSERIVWLVANKIK